MNQQQSSNGISIDEMFVDITNTQSGEVHASNVSEKIRSLTRGLTSTESFINPLVVVKAVRWGYIHREGVLDPTLWWAVELVH